MRNRFFNRGFCAFAHPEHTRYAQKAFTGKDIRMRFCPDIGPESTLPDGNPSKGWYKIFPYDISEEPDWKETEYSLNRDEVLVMVQLDIGAYADRDIDTQAIELMRRILDFFIDYGYELIVRPVYDREGRGMENEPLSLMRVRQHMKQIGEVLKDYADSIIVLQGLFVGSWGEMHGSKFLTPDRMRLLRDTLYEATGGLIPMAVRTPGQWRLLNSEEQFRMPDTGYKVMGLYNDAIMASETDCGTYSADISNNNEWSNSWNRESELAFQEKLCNYSFNGGETVTENPLNDFESACVNLARMHVTYLNSQYDKTVLDKWRNAEYSGKGVFFGINGYDYIGMHLGYRFVVQDAAISHRRKELLINIANTGFACIYEETELLLKVEAASGEIMDCAIAADARQWYSNTIVMVKADISGIVLKPDENAGVWLELRRKKDGRYIRFANEGANDRIYIGELNG